MNGKTQKDISKADRLAGSLNNTLSSFEYRQKRK